MAYPTVDATYGLKPVNLIGGQVFAGATRLMQIATLRDAELEKVRTAFYDKQKADQEKANKERAVAEVLGSHCRLLVRV